MGITNSSFEYGISGLYRLTPTIIPNNGFEYGISAIQPLMNIFPKKPTLISPVNGRRESSMPTFVFNVERDYNNDNMHMELRISEKEDLSDSIVFTSHTDIVGWEYYNKATSKWLAFTESGIPDSALVTGDTNARYTPSIELLQSRLFYWGVRAYDLKDYSYVSDIRTLKSSNVLSVQLNEPILTTINAEKIIVTSYSIIPTDGATRAQVKVFVTNNGFDVNPVWEDATEKVLSKNSYTFTNTSKTAIEWGVNVRYEIHANDSLEEISLNALGISFS